MIKVKKVMKIQIKLAKKMKIKIKQMSIIIIIILDSNIYQFYNYIELNKNKIINKYILFFFNNYIIFTILLII